MPFLGSCTIGGGGVGYTVNANGLKEEMIRKANLAGFPSGPSHRQPSMLPDMVDLFNQAQARMAILSTRRSDRLRHDPVVEFHTTNQVYCDTTGRGELLTCGDVESNPGPNTER